MNIDVLAADGGVTFGCAANQRILHSALAAGVFLPHECISGTCGSCKARLVDGEVKNHWPEAPAVRSLKRDEVLLCQCTPAADCKVEISSPLRPFPSATRPSTLEGRVEGWRLLCPDVASFRVELDRQVEFEAGQFVAFQFPSVAGARCYSMVNADSPTSSLEFVIKRKPGGALSDWLFSGDPSGAAVTGFGPVGLAVFDQRTSGNFLCVAGGSGIAGMMSILARAEAANHFEQHWACVYFGVRRGEDAFFLDRLNELAARNKSLSVCVALSEAVPSEDLVKSFPGVSFRQGLVHAVMAEEMAGRDRPSVAYLAGPPPAVTASIGVLLTKLRLSGQAIKYDKFG